MADTAERVPLALRPVAATTPRPRSSRRDDLVTVLAGTWLVVGLFVDGWAHANLVELETFFTPWHGLLYSGFAACAGWLAWQVIRNQERGLPLARAVPVGYGLGVVGAAVFGVGGASDSVWHTLLGIEASIEALLSPPHLVMFTGAALVLTTPLRAAWHRPDPAGAAPSLRAFLPALLSLVLTALLVAFFFMYWGAFTTFAWTPGVAAEARADDITFFVQSTGVAEVLVTNVVVLFPLLLALRRWRLPAGTATILFAAVAVGLNGIEAFASWWLVVPAVAGGAVADVLAARWRVGPGGSVRALRAWAVVVPLVLWSLFFVAVALGTGIGWPATLWGGAIIFAALSGLALSLLAAPPPIPSPDAADTPR